MKQKTDNWEYNKAKVWSLKNQENFKKGENTNYQYQHEKWFIIPDSINLKNI